MPLSDRMKYGSSGSGEYSTVALGNLLAYRIINILLALTLVECIISILK